MRRETTAAYCITTSQYARAFSGFLMRNAQTSNPDLAQVQLFLVVLFHGLLQFKDEKWIIRGLIIMVIKNTQKHVSDTSCKKGIFEP
jgi:hypothetical protein